MAEKNELYLKTLNFNSEHIRHEKYVSLRYDGTDTALMIQINSKLEKDDILE